MVVQVTQGIPFSFAPRTDLVGELTNGQRFMEAIFNALEDTWKDQNCGFMVKLASSAMADDVHASVIELLRKYESLRTCFEREGRAATMQIVQTEGMVPITRIEAEDLNCEKLAKALYTQLLSHHFTLQDLPVKVGYVSSRSGPKFAIMVFSHMAVDGSSVALLRDEFQAAVNGDPYTDHGYARQPLDQTAWEKSAEGTYIQNRSIAYWKNELVEFPTRMFRARVSPRLTWNELNFVSEKMGDCIEILSSVLGRPKTTVMITALGCSLAEHAKTDFFATTIYTANRQLKGTQYVIANIAQVSPLRLEVSSSFEKTCNSVSAKIFNCCRNGLIDIRAVADLTGVGSKEPTVLDNRINLLYPGRRHDESAQARFALCDYRTPIKNWGPRRGAGLNTLSIRSYRPNSVYYVFDEGYFSIQDIEHIAERVVEVLVTATQQFIQSAPLGEGGAQKCDPISTAE